MPPTSLALSRPSETPLGHVEPRLATPPLRELTPETSYGFAVIDFARDVLGKPLRPWQERAAVIGGELLADGRPRFRKVLLVVSRQQGKTHLKATLADFWLFVEEHKTILGLSHKLEMAREAWQLAQEMAQDSPWLSPEFGHVLRGNNDPHWKVASGSRYKIAAATRGGGRGLTISRLMFDELREQQGWTSYNAVMHTMNAIAGAQAWLFSNQGGDASVVLNSLRDTALADIEGAGLDPELCLIEFSAPTGADPLDPGTLLQAIPNLGRSGRSLESYLGEARAAVAAGGEQLTGFLTEVLCQRVPVLDPAVEPGPWALCHVPGDLAGIANLAACVDVSPDLMHASLAVAGVLPDGRVRALVAAAWEGDRAASEMEGDLPELLGRIKPKTLGWLSGPAAASAATLADRKGRTSWPPRGVTVQKIADETTAVCMGLAVQVRALGVVHSDEPLLNAHVLGAEKLARGDAWVFSRKGGGHCDAAYAFAGAVHLARTMPTPMGQPLFLTGKVGAKQ